MISRVGESRKVRSDKKIDVKPSLPSDLYDCICRMAYVLMLPIKDVGEIILLEGLSSSFVLEEISPFLVRDYARGKTIYMGDLDASGSRRIKIKGRRKRLSLRLNQDAYLRLSNLAHALDLTISSATTLIIIHALRDVALVEKVLKENQHYMLNSNQIKERRYILKKSKKGGWEYDATR